MSDKPYEYHAYLLRRWRIHWKGQWRASLESPHTGECQSFADLEQCFTFMREQCSSQALRELDVERRAMEEEIRTCGDTVNCKR